MCFVPAIVLLDRHLRQHALPVALAAAVAQLRIPGVQQAAGVPILATHTHVALGRIALPCPRQ